MSIQKPRVNPWAQLSGHSTLSTRPDFDVREFARRTVLREMQQNEEAIKEALIAYGWTPPGEIVGSNEVLAKRIAELTRQLSAAQEELRQVKVNARRAVEMMEAALNAPTY